MLSALSLIDLQNKRVLIREDLNVPIDSMGQIADDTRIRRALPTIQTALKEGAAIILLSHWGRPEEGHFDRAFSLAPVATRLSELLEQPVLLQSNWLDGVSVSPGEVVLCENVRFNRGEKNNDAELAKKMAALCDVFVMDAFATAHRSEASTVGVAQHAPIACAGPLLLEELEALSRVLKDPERPVVAVVGGSKVSTKIGLLESLLPQVDCLIVGGGIANTLLVAQGYSIGASLYEPAWLDKARHFFEVAEKHDVKLPLPVDVVVAQEISEKAYTRITPVSDIQPLEKIVDVGPETISEYIEWIDSAGSIIWNGPVGVFEYAPFSQGTKALAQAIASSPAFSVAGGGDTLSAIAKFGVGEGISYLSTGGGAFLALLESGELPAVRVLESRG